MSKNTIVINNRDEFIKFITDRVLCLFAQEMIKKSKPVQIRTDLFEIIASEDVENLMEAIRFHITFKTVNTPKETSFPILMKVDEYNSMLVVNGVDKTPLHRGANFTKEFEVLMDTLCERFSYDAEKGIIKTGCALADKMEVETFFCYERMEKPKPKVTGSSTNKDMEIVGNLQEGEKVIPNEPFKVSIKDKTITVKVSKGYIVNVESM